MKKFLALALIALVGMVASQTMTAQLPNVTVKDAKGRAVNVAKLSNNGKPIVISFFATWCKPCLRELKAISEVYPDWQDETGMKMYIVSIDEAQNTAKVKPFVDAEGWNYELLLDPNSDFFHAMGLQSVPHTLILDGQGKVVYNHSGYTDGGEDQIIKTIRQLKSKK